jgi:hypothetical protein
MSYSRIGHLYLDFERAAWTRRTPFNLRLYPDPSLDHFRIMDPFPQVAPTRHMAFLTGSLILTPDAIFPLSIGVLQRLSVDQQCISRVKLMTASTKLSPLKVWGPLNTPMIRHIARIPASIVSFGFGWAKASMPPDMTGGAGDPPQLELRIKAGILFVAPFALSSSLSNKGHLLTQGGMTGHAEAPFLGATSIKVDDLAPGAWPHSHAV